MRFDQLGNLAAGVSGGPFSVNRTTVALGTTPRALQPGVFIAHCTSGPDTQDFCCRILRSATNWKPEQLNVRAATRAAAGAGRWLAWDTHVCYGNVPCPEDWVPLDGAHDGTLVLTDLGYQTMHVLRADGSTMGYPVPPTVNFESVRAIEGGDFSWVNNGELEVQFRGQVLRQVKAVEKPFDPHVVNVLGRWWVLYHNSKTWLHPLDELVGYELAASYYPDIWVANAGAATSLVALTPSAGEVPESIQYVALVIGDGTKPLTPDPPPPPPPTVYIRPLPRRIYLAPLKAVNDRADYGIHTGPWNAVTLECSWSLMPDVKPAILTEPFFYTAPADAARGLFSSAESGAVDLASWVKTRNAGIAAKRPVIINLDGAGAVWARNPDFFDKYCQPQLGLELIGAMELYPFRWDGEGKPSTHGTLASIPEIEAEWNWGTDWLLKRFKRVAFHLSWYTQSGNYPIELIVALQEVMRRVLDRVPDDRLFALEPFAIGRPSGVVSYPVELQPVVNAWAAAIPQSGEWPALLVLDPMPPPIPPPDPQPPQPIPPHPQPPVDPSRVRQFMIFQGVSSMSQLTTLVAGSAFASVNGNTVLQLNSPLQQDYLGLAERGYPKGTALKDQDNHPITDGRLVNLSVNPDTGELGCRPTDWTGSWEVPKKSGGLAVYKGNGRASFVIPYAD